MIPARATIVFLALLAAGTASGDDRFTVPVSASIDLDLIDNALDSGDVRVLVLGDSFAYARWNRVFPEILNHWPYGPLVAMAGGSAPNSSVVRGESSGAPFPGIQAQPENSYEVLLSSPETAYFALPVRMREAFFDAGFGLPMGEPLIDFKALTGGDAPSWADAAGEFGFRMLYWLSPLANVPRVMLNNQMVDLSGYTGHINATPTQFFSHGGGGSVSFEVFADPATLGTDSYFHPAGGVFFKVDENGVRVPGIYFTYLSDSSWSYEGFGNDQSSIAGEKGYSVEQMSHWLEASTIDPDQRVVVFYYLAAEGVSDLQTGDQAELEGMIDQTNAAISMTSIAGPVRHCLVLPHYHASPGGLVVNDETRVWFEAQRDAMFRIATQRPDVASASIYDATLGVLHLEFLDNFRVHPTTEGAQYFSSCLTRLLAGRCDGDANMDGAVNFDDINSVLGNWLSFGPAGDSHSDHIVDFDDITTVLGRWNATCGP